MYKMRICIGHVHAQPLKLCYTPFQLQYQCEQKEKKETENITEKKEKLLTNFKSNLHAEINALRCMNM